MSTSSPGRADARAIHAKVGDQLIASETHESFGRQLVGETWELTL